MKPTQAWVQGSFMYGGGMLFWKFDGPRIKKGDRAGGNSDRPHKKIILDGVPYYETQLIYLYHHGIIPMRIKHRNDDRTDNRIENLCTHHEYRRMKK